MNTRAIIVGIIILITAGGGIYWYIKHPSTTSAPSDQQQTQTDSAATSTTQVQGQDVTVGTGAEATPGSKVTVEYVGKLQDGTTFDSSASHNQPLIFQLGSAGLIPGFQIGINGMKVGGERVILIPPSLGYGTQEIKDSSGKVIIPPNSNLIFNLKLTKVEAGSSTPTQAPPAKQPAGAKTQ